MLRWTVRLEPAPRRGPGEAIGNGVYDFVKLLWSGRRRRTWLSVRLPRAGPVPSASLVADGRRRP